MKQEEKQYILTDSNSKCLRTIMRTHITCLMHLYSCGFVEYYMIEPMLKALDEVDRSLRYRRPNKKVTFHRESLTEVFDLIDAMKFDKRDVINE